MNNTADWKDGNVNNKKEMATTTSGIESPSPSLSGSTSTATTNTTATTTKPPPTKNPTIGNHNGVTNTMDSAPPTPSTTTTTFQSTTTVVGPSTFVSSTSGFSSDHESYFSNIPPEWTAMMANNNNSSNNNNNKKEMTTTSGIDSLSKENTDPTAWASVGETKDGGKKKQLENHFSDPTTWSQRKMKIVFRRHSSSTSSSSSSSPTRYGEGEFYDDDEELCFSEKYRIPYGSNCRSGDYDNNYPALKETHKGSDGNERAVLEMLNPELGLPKEVKKDPEVARLFYEDLVFVNSTQHVVVCHESNTELFLSWELLQGRSTIRRVKKGSRVTLATLTSRLDPNVGSKYTYAFMNKETGKMFEFKPTKNGEEFEILQGTIVPNIYDPILEKKKPSLAGSKPPPSPAPPTSPKPDTVTSLGSEDQHPIESTPSRTAATPPTTPVREATTVPSSQSSSSSSTNLSPEPKSPSNYTVLRHCYEDDRTTLSPDEIGPRSSYRIGPHKHNHDFDRDQKLMMIEAHKKVQELSDEIEGLEYYNATLEEVNATLQRDLQEANAKATKLSEQNTAFQEANTTLQTTVNDQQRQLLEKQQELLEKQRQLQEKERENHELRAQLLLAQQQQQQQQRDAAELHPAANDDDDDDDDQEDPEDDQCHGIVAKTGNRCTLRGSKRTGQDPRFCHLHQNQANNQEN